RHARRIHPEALVDAAAIEDLDRHLDVVRAEEPEIATVARELHAMAVPLVAVRRAPERGDREACQAELVSAGNALLAPFECTQVAGGATGPGGAALVVGLAGSRP